MNAREHYGERRPRSFIASRALRPAAFASLRFAAGRPLTASFPGKIRHLPGGRGGAKLQGDHREHRCNEGADGIKDIQTIRIWATLNAEPLTLLTTQNTQPNVLRSRKCASYLCH